MENMEFALPPSVNWYSFQSLDVSSHGVVAYASMRECVITKLSIDKGMFMIFYNYAFKKLKYTFYFFNL